MFRKPNITQEEVSRILLENVLIMWTNLFEDSKELFRDGSDPFEPELMDRFESDYRNAVEVLKHLHSETHGNFTLKDLYDRLPDNVWIDWQHDILAARTVEDPEGRLPVLPKEDDKESFHQMLRERKQKKYLM